MVEMTCALAWVPTAESSETKQFRKRQVFAVTDRFKPDGAIPDVTFGTKRRNEAIYSDSEATLLENTLRVSPTCGRAGEKRG